MKVEVDEKALVKSVLLRDKAAFEKLIKQYEGLVIHIVVPLISNQDDRDDLCQDVFLKVYEKLYSFQFKSKLSTWIGNIAYNTAINFLRKKKNTLVDDILNFNPDNDSNSIYIVEEIVTENPEKKLILQEEKVFLQAAVDKLPPIQKTLIVLFHQDELPLAEIGAIMDLPVNTVKSHLFRARATLKELLLQRYKI